LNSDIRLRALATKVQLTELAKIQYLFALIGNSPFTFIRNGEEHNGREASAHLRWKYGHAFDRIKTDEEFINHIASGSLASGKPYEVKFSDGSVMRMKEVLFAESRRLESFDDQPHRTGSIPLSLPVLYFLPVWFGGDLSIILFGW